MMPSTKHPKPQIEQLRKSHNEIDPYKIATYQLADEKVIGI
jgi:hypothetical protein